MYSLHPGLDTGPLGSGKSVHPIAKGGRLVKVLVAVALQRADSREDFAWGAQPASVCTSGPQAGRLGLVFQPISTTKLRNSWHHKVRAESTKSSHVHGTGQVGTTRVGSEKVCETMCKLKALLLKTSRYG